MDFLHIGYMNIPVSLAGMIANFLGLYCSWTNRRSILSNSDKLALTLNILNAVFCTFLLPIKIIWYLTYPTMNVKPLFIGYIDASRLSSLPFSSPWLHSIVTSRFQKHLDIMWSCQVVAYINWYFQCLLCQWHCQCRCLSI